MSDKLPLRDEFVVNASPLITLFKSGLEFVLPELFGTVIVPGAVWQEVSNCDDDASEGLKTSPWAIRKKVRTDRRVAVWNLGSGETDVLSLSLKNSNRVAIIDDLAARRCAVSLTIRHIGTAGVLVLASRHKLIPSLRNAFSQVRNAGLYLKDDLVERLIIEEGRE
ncbi:MAG: DUF3368 domain-containing protein [Deltaproteobacteria bacterium]|nr:MAG: DUF3368 domain-containing protein [Deltaproteobacteria bacterium]